MSKEDRQKITRVLQKVGGTGDKQEREYFKIHRRRYAHVLAWVMQLAGGNKLRILDVGCFPMHITHALRAFGHDVYGIASEHEQVRDKKVSVLDIESDPLPWANGYFDIVLVNEVIEHLPHSPIFALREVWRVLRQGGYVMLSTPNQAKLVNRLKLVFGRSIYFATWRYFENEGRGDSLFHRHNREYTMKELVAMLIKVGWKVDRRGYLSSFIPFGKKESIVQKLLKGGYFGLVWLFPPWQDTLYILAKK